MRAAAIAFVILVVARSAAAGPFDVFGFGSRAIAMGNAATATADDYTAAFYNPANLVLRKKVHLGAEFLTAFPSLEIRTVNAGDGSLQPLAANGFTGLGLGVLFPLGGKVDYRFAFGMVLYLPTDQLLRADALDPLIPRWYLWDSLADKLQILIAVGGEITPWLRLGIGVQSLAAVEGTAAVELDLINEEIRSREIDVELVNTLAPVMGLSLGPFAGVSAGFSWRGELALDFELPVDLDLGESLDALLLTRGSALYTPHTLSFGVAWDIPDSGWLIAADLHYQLWSQAPDPALYFAVDLDGELLRGLGVEDAVDLLPGPTGIPGFSDTLSAHVGAELWFSEHFVGRAGYQFRPTPVPEQVGLTNYVDADAHTICAGVGVTHPDPLNLDDEPVTFEVTGAYALVPDRTTIKESTSDPIGDYSAGGQVFTLSITLRHDF